MMRAAKESPSTMRDRVRPAAALVMSPRGVRLARVAAVLVIALVLLAVAGTPRFARAAEPAVTPYRTIVLLDVRFPTSRGTCTGFLVGAHTVATAGHCLYNRDAGGWAVAVGVIPGVNGIDAPFGRQTATVFDVAPGYVRTGDPSLDYGAITLASDLLGIATGHFEVATGSDAQLRDGEFETAGYASGATWGTQWRMPRRALDGFDRTVLTYAWGTTPGMSGAPIFEPGGNAGTFRALGMVTGSVEVAGHAVEMGLRADPGMLEFYRAAVARPATAASDAPARTAFIARRGRSVTVTSTPMAAAVPIVLQCSPDRVRWQTIASSTTDSAGVSAFTIAPTETLYYRMVALGVGPGAVSQGVVDPDGPDDERKAGS